MRLCGYHRVDSYSLFVLPLAQIPAEVQKPGHTRPNHQKFREHSLFLTAFAAQRGLMAHRALMAHTFFRGPPRKRPQVACVRGARRSIQAGYSPPVCCIINW
jgi:hypothetical protein